MITALRGRERRGLHCQHADNNQNPQQRLCSCCDEKAWWNLNCPIPCLFLEYAVHRACVDRVVQLARDYAARRTAFGKPLKDHALHLQTLARMEVNRRAQISC